MKKSLLVVIVSVLFVGLLAPSTNAQIKIPFIHGKKQPSVAPAPARQTELALEATPAAPAAQAMFPHGITASAETTASGDTKTSTTLLNVEEPKWPGRVYSLSGGKLVELESQRPVMSTKSKFLTYGGITSSFIYTGPASPTRTTANPVFHVKMGETEDPMALFSLKKLALSKENNRTIFLAKMGPFGMGNKTASDTLSAEMHFDKDSKGVVEITLAHPLERGEYAITNGTISWLFGVD